MAKWGRSVKWDRSFGLQIQRGLLISICIKAIYFFIPSYLILSVVTTILLAYFIPKDLSNKNFWKENIVAYAFWGAFYSMDAIFQHIKYSKDRALDYETILHLTLSFIPINEFEYKKIDKSSFYEILTLNYEMVLFVFFFTFSLVALLRLARQSIYSQYETPFIFSFSIKVALFTTIVFFFYVCYCLWYIYFYWPNTNSAILYSAMFARDFIIVLTAIIFIEFALAIFYGFYSKLMRVTSSLTTCSQIYLEFEFTAHTVHSIFINIPKVTLYMLVFSTQIITFNENGFCFYLGCFFWLTLNTIEEDEDNYGKIGVINLKDNRVLVAYICFLGVIYYCGIFYYVFPVIKNCFAI